MQIDGASEEIKKFQNTSNNNLKLYIDDLLTKYNNNVYTDSGFIKEFAQYYIDNKIEIPYHPDHTNDDFYCQRETKIDIARKIPQEFILSNELKQGLTKISL